MARHRDPALGSHPSGSSDKPCNLRITSITEMCSGRCSRTSAHWWPMSPCLFLSTLQGSRPWSPDPARRRRARRGGTLLERNQRPAGYQERRSGSETLSRRIGCVPTPELRQGINPVISAHNFSAPSTPGCCSPGGPGILCQRGPSATHGRQGHRTTPTMVYSLTFQSRRQLEGRRFPYRWQARLRGGWRTFRMKSRLGSVTGTNGRLIALSVSARKRLLGGRTRDLNRYSGNCGMSPVGMTGSLGSSPTAQSASTTDLQIVRERMPVGFEGHIESGFCAAGGSPRDAVGRLGFRAGRSRSPRPSLL